MQAVEAALATEDAAGAGGLARLQSACAALDEATKPLPDLLMDRAMEALLRGSAERSRKGTTADQRSRKRLLVIT